MRETRHSWPRHLSISGRHQNIAWLGLPPHKGVFRIKGVLFIRYALEFHKGCALHTLRVEATTTMNEAPPPPAVFTHLLLNSHTFVVPPPFSLPLPSPPRLSCVPVPRSPSKRGRTPPLLRCARLAPSSSDEVLLVQVFAPSACMRRPHRAPSLSTAPRTRFSYPGIALTRAQSIATRTLAAHVDAPRRPRRSRRPARASPGNRCCAVNRTATQGSQGHKHRHKL